jgi:GT2 family glycosyltransferase
LSAASHAGRPLAPNVVIVVVTWNGLQDTVVCLMALRQLDYAPKQIVLVDNGSQDGTPGVVRRYFPEIHLIANTHNTGYVHANNQGIAWALDQGAEWILLLNNDVIMAPDALSEMVRMGETTFGAGIVGPVMQRTLRPDIFDLGGDLNFRWGSVRLRRYTSAQNGCASMPVDYVWGCALMARRAVFEQIGGLEPLYVAYFEDAELCVRAARLGHRTITALRARVLHQVGRSGEKRFVWQTYLRMRNHALFFLRLSRPSQWLTLMPALFFYQLPLIFVRSLRVYLARKLRRRKYAHRPITLWGYEGQLVRPTQEQIDVWLCEAGYFTDEGEYAVFDHHHHA